jgi:hypothetical protein
LNKEVERIDGGDGDAREIKNNSSLSVICPNLSELLTFKVCVRSKHKPGTEFFSDNDVVYVRNIRTGHLFMEMLLSASEIRYRIFSVIERFPYPNVLAKFM